MTIYIDFIFHEISDLLVQGIVSDPDNNRIVHFTQPWAGGENKLDRWFAIADNVHAMLLCDFGPVVMDWCAFFYSCHRCCRRLI